MKQMSVRLQLFGIALILFGGFILLDPSSTMLGLEVWAMLVGLAIVFGGLFYRGD